MCRLQRFCFNLAEVKDREWAPTVVYPHGNLTSLDLFINLSPQFIGNSVSAQPSSCPPIQRQSYCFHPLDLFCIVTLIVPCVISKGYDFLLRDLKTNQFVKKSNKSTEDFSREDVRDLTCLMKKVLMRRERSDLSFLVL